MLPSNILPGSLPGSACTETPAATNGWSGNTGCKYCCGTTGCKNGCCCCWKACTNISTLPLMECKSSWKLSNRCSKRLTRADRSKTHHEINKNTNLRLCRRLLREKTNFHPTPHPEDPSLRATLKLPDQRIAFDSAYPQTSSAKRHR